MGKFGDTLAAGLTGGLVGAAKTPGFEDVLGFLSPVYGLIADRGPLRMIREDEEKERKRGRALTSDSSTSGMKRGGKVKKMAKGGSASSRADGCCSKGKTKGRMR